MTPALGVDALDGYQAPPPGSHQLLTPPAPEPPFDDPGELAAVWGAAWGASDEVGRLRKVLVRAPGPALDAISLAGYRPELDALVDPAGNWYFTGSDAPDLERFRAEHQGLVDVLRAEGVEVHVADALPFPFTKAGYVRDPLVTVRGGAIIGRLAPRMRRGEEADITRTVAELGLPILATTVGAGTLEGGSFMKLRPGLAVLGTSVRCNRAGAEQLREVLARLGWELLIVDLPGFVVHLDIHFAMVDRNRALINAGGLPYTFMEDLRQLGIELIWAHPDEPWGLNLLTLSPGRVLTSTAAPKTAEVLRERGIEVLTIPFDEVHRNGGGIHCSTMELLRDDA